MAQELQNSNPQDNEEILTLHEAAKKAQCSYSAIIKALHRSPIIKEQYTTKRSINGRIQTIITLDGLVVLLNTKNSTGRKKDTVSFFHASKKRLAEKHIALSKTIPILLERIEALEAKMDNSTVSKLAAPNALLLPAPTEEVPELTTRDRIRQRITLFLAERHGDLSSEHFRHAWQRLYQELYWRYGFSVNARKQIGEDCLDVCERCNMMEKLYALACKLFPTSSDS